ncbi:MAG: hypothetical protein H0T62_03950 [Parachlamydiaceae bacterium]|nr:hypothetical protein [Parachlamydiaceae bacterium]
MIFSTPEMGLSQNAYLKTPPEKITTNNYIEKFNEQNNRTCFTKWMHDNPTTLKVVQIASVLIGVAAIASLPWTLPAVGIAIASTIAVTGGVLLLATLASWLFQKYLTSDKHEITEQVFQAGEHEFGRLYYRGNIPILELDDSNPYGAGLAHASLLGEHIHRLKKNLDLILHGILRKPDADQIPKVIEALKREIPEEYLEEMKGLTDGFNQWAKETNNSAPHVTVEDVLLMHLIADIKHFNPSQVENTLSGHKSIWERISDALTPSPACTTLLHRDEEKGVIFGRNMDWCPFGHGGGESLFVVWKHSGVATLGVPGLIGAGTGWNRDRLTFAMNVSPGETSEVRGMPSMLYNRHIVQNAHSVEDAESLMERVKPLGPYHLTLADPSGNGKSVSFYQGENQTDHIRSLDEDEDLDEEVLQVLNYTYPKLEGNIFNSEGRRELLNRYFGGANKDINEGKSEWYNLIDNALKLTPLVNAWMTLHSLMLVPQSGDVAVSWDNGYAADMPRQNINMDEFFPRSQMSESQEGEEI